MVANAQPHEENGLIGRLTRQTSSVRRRVKNGAKALREQTAQKANRISRALQEEADRLLGDKKGQAAQKLEKLSSAAHRVAHVLHAGKIDKVAEYVDMAAERTDGLAKYIKDSDLGDMTADLAEIVRRHPAAMYGAMLITGIALARLLMAAQAEDGADKDAPDVQEEENSQPRQRRLSARRRMDR